MLIPAFSIKYNQKKAQVDDFKAQLIFKLGVRDSLGSFYKAGKVTGIKASDWSVLGRGGEQT